MKTVDAQVGARIPQALKEKLDHFCREHGLKMGHVVAAALEDKLGEMEEELEDRALGRERLKDGDFVPQDELTRYVKRRRASR